MREAKEINKMRIVYQLPEMDQIIVCKDIIYKTVDTTNLKMDIYYPQTRQSSTVHPAVVFIHGGSQPEQVEHVRTAQQYVSWCQLIATSGFIAIMFHHRTDEGYTKLSHPEDDIKDAFRFIRMHSLSLGINSEALGIWTCSSGSLYGVSHILRTLPTYIRCIASYYGGMTLLNKKYFHFSVEEEKVARKYSPDILLKEVDPTRVAPFFIARAGRDRSFLNDVLDSFICTAITRNIPLTLMNHPTGEHGFDLFNDDERSREIIRATLTFFTEHLGDKTQ